MFFRYILLVAAAAVIISGCRSGSAQGAAYKTLNAQGFYGLVTRPGPDTVVMDIRTPEEYISGHVKNAVNLDFYSADFQKELSRLDKSKTYLVYCRSGSRTAQTLPIMQILGFRKIILLEGGLLEWVSRGYPLEK
jgi:rhodanese-related sulfurtransferase